jgi:peptide/nickel transport system permease protein
LLIVTFLVTMLLSLVPGDPAVTIASAGGMASPEQIDEARERFNLDDSPLERYVRWVGDAVKFDLGESYETSKSVTSELASRLPVTLGLALASLVIAVAIGFPLGLFAGIRPGGTSDRFSRVFSSLGLAIPSFLLGIILVVVFAVRLGWLPPSGYVNITESPSEWLRHIILPALTLAVVLAAGFSRQLRAALVDQLGSRYVQAAWARGGSRRTVVGKHALKNASIAPITLLAIQFGYLLGGTVIIEQIFSIPGIGPYLLKAIINLDLPVIQGVTLVFVLTQMMMSLIVDLAYGALNPKVRVS